MRAAVYTRYGPPDVVQIREVAKPAPKAGEILVRVHATTICAPDWRFRKPDPFFIRLINGLFSPKRQILGVEFAGRVEAVGMEVARFAVGDDVFGVMGFKFGAHAEYVCVPEERGLALIPRNMSYDEAAAIMFGGISALHFLREANIKAGQNVLIYGASGSVGTAAVQLAKHFGAHVTGVCSTANLDLVKSLGADAVVDYTREDFSSVGCVYDIVVDTVGKSGFSRTLRALKRGGFYAQVLIDPASSPGWLWASLNGRAKVVDGIARTQPGDQEFLRGLAESGRLRTVIDRRYRLEEIAEAHRYVEAGHKKGNVIIVVA